MARWINAVSVALLLLPAVALAEPCCLGLSCVDLSLFECVEQHGAVGYCFGGLPCGAASCSIGSLGAISDLRVVKRTGTSGTDVVFTWSADPAADRYDLRHALSKDRVPACDGCAGSSPVDGSAPTFVPAAVHRAAVDGPAGITFFYDVRPGCGDGSDVLGACCVSSQCSLERSLLDCSSNGGTYAGDLSRCDEVSCPVTLGSCCIPGGSCAIQVSEAYCSHTRGRWENAATCTGCMREWVSGACCLPSGCTEATDPFACAAAQGTYLGDFTTCAGNPCAIGSCCRPDTSCIPNTTAASCAAVSGTYTLATGCLSPCLGEPGACCDGVACRDGVLYRQCATIWRGPFSTCASTACPPACCIGVSCGYQSPANCLAAGGSPQGAGVPCAAAPCSRGWCCLAGSCDVVTEAECATRGGEYGGAGSSCAAGVCATGACCSGSGCAERTASSCAAQFGSFRGIGTTCASVSFCRGACCWTGGCENDLTPDDCTGLSGTHQGDGTTCASDSCTEACCLRHGCAVLPIETCIAGGGQTSSPRCPTCDSAPCVPLPFRGKCCGLFGCRDSTSDECERRGGTWDVSEQCAQPCALGSGACCEGTACRVTTGLLCQLSGGQFLPEAICDRNGQCVGSTVCSCASTPCATGACCGIDTGCAILNEKECCIRGGVLEVGGTCSPACDLAPCCLGGQCVLLAPGVCAADGGAANGCAIGGAC